MVAWCAGLPPSDPIKELHHFVSSHLHTKLLPRIASATSHTHDHLLCIAKHAGRPHPSAPAALYASALPPPALLPPRCSIPTEPRRAGSSSSCHRYNSEGVDLVKLRESDEYRQHRAIQVKSEIAEQACIGHHSALMPEEAIELILCPSSQEVACVALSALRRAVDTRPADVVQLN